MGFQLLRISTHPSSKTILLIRQRPLSHISSHISSSKFPRSGGFRRTQLSFASQSLSTSALTAEFGGVCSQKRKIRSGVVMASSGSVQKSEEEWRAVLSPEQFRILRQKGTEYPGTGQYDKFFGDGIYGCAGCGTPLYKSTTKFNSGCGWPAFYEGLPGAINRTADPDGRRIEITCSACGGHLGHVFKGEGFKTPTDERHCVNSVSIKFTPAS